MKTDIILRVLAAGQLSVAMLNFFLPRLMNWKPDIERMPLLIREVFQIHAWFISVTLAIFATLTWRFASEMGANPIGKWLCAGIGIFWAIRTVLQITHYSSSHWKGQMGRTIIHIVLLTAYGSMALIYLAVGFGKGGSL